MKILSIALAIALLGNIAQAPFVYHQLKHDIIEKSLLSKEGQEMMEQLQAKRDLKTNMRMAELLSPALIKGKK